MISGGGRKLRNLTGFDGRGLWRNGDSDDFFVRAGARCCKRSDPGNTHNPQDGFARPESVSLYQEFTSAWLATSV
jgi:hypothetical protein